MTFSNVDEAYQFYSRYAYEVGFPLKRYRETKNCNWLNCSMDGVHLTLTFWKKMYVKWYEKNEINGA
jgi:hypothetical protein